MPILTFSARPSQTRPQRAHLLIALFCAVLAINGTTRVAASPAFFTSVLGTTAQADTVQVSIRWSADLMADEPVLLGLHAHDGHEVAASWVWPQPGETSTHALDGAFVDATARPQQHTLRLSDGGGELLTEPYPVLFGLQCEAPDLCRFTVRGGVSAPEMIVLRPAMADALEEAEAAGAEDLLRFVGEQQPQLWGDIYSLAWQLGARRNDSTDFGDYREAAGAPGDSAPGDCSCHWTLQVADQPLSVQESQGLGSASEPTCGAAHGMTYQRLGSLTESTTAVVSGHSSVTPDVGCWKVTDGDPQNISISGGTEISIRVLALAPCQVDCQGSVVFNGTYTTHMTTSTRTAGDAVFIQDGFVFHVGSAQVAWNLFGLSSQGGRDLQSTQSQTASAFAGLGTTAEISSGSSIRLDYDPQGLPTGGGLNLLCAGMSGAAPCAEGITQGTYEIYLQGQSSCTSSLLFEASATTQAAPSADGISGDDITILVGKCNDD